ncbi:MAG: lytic transglycosylase domain-containing protein [Candidatus Omnitrophica bacterium]|nr:lytic transglycosylase domain-containing protein [Candidatus Omnitrophota bacterium]
MNRLKIILFGGVVFFLSFSVVKSLVYAEEFGLWNNTRRSEMSASNLPSITFQEDGFLGYVNGTFEGEDVYIRRDGEKVKVLGVVKGSDTPWTFQITHPPPFFSNHWYIEVERPNGDRLLYDSVYWDGILFRKLFNENDIPVLLPALISAESLNNPLAVSSSGARGLTQIKPVAWNDLVRVYPEIYGNLVYERDIFKPTIARQAGADYLRIVLGYLQFYGMSAIVDNILAAYNGGIGNLRDHGLENASEETVDYIRKIKRLLFNPEPSAG